MNTTANTEKNSSLSTRREAFRDHCYGKYILSRIAMELPLNTVLSLMEEWKNTEGSGNFLSFLNGKGIIFPAKEEFLEKKYQDSGYLAGILTEGEFRSWTALEHPDSHGGELSMAYADAKKLLELCIRHGILNETRAVYLVSVYKGNMVSSVTGLEECTQSLMRDREGQEELKNALLEKGVTFEPKFGFLLHRREQA